MLDGRRVMAIVAMSLLTGALAACGDDGGGGGGSGDAVVIENLSFSIPSGLEAGATITVENRDGTTHTFTADGGEFDTDNISGGDSAQITLPSPGEYAVHCKIHSSMTGTVKVA